jgi:hypothetical protein
MILFVCLAPSLFEFLISEGMNKPRVPSVINFESV